jgi:hypothetical protein
MRAVPANLFTAIGLAVFPLTATASDAARVAELVRIVADLSTTDQARRAPIEELQKIDARLVLPAVLTAMDGIRIDRVSFDDPNRLSPESRAWRALDQVWIHAVSPASPTSSHPGGHENAAKASLAAASRPRTPDEGEGIARVLAPLLKAAKSEATRLRVLGALGRNPSPHAEAAVVSLLRAQRDTEQVTAAEMLLRRNPRKYAPEVVAIVEDARRDEVDRLWALNAFMGPPFKELGDDDKRRVIRAGFTLLAADKSYATATRLEDFVDRQFRPDQRQAKYQGKNGLNDDFFADTVTEALAWWGRHHADYESK